jgi:cytochrome c oxidase cbb3-type subunit III
MGNIRSTRVAGLLMALGAWASWGPAGSAGGQQHAEQPPAASRPQRDGAATAAGNPTRGHDIFVNNCAVCHGVDATGGEGPNIQRAPANLGEAAVGNIILRGVPGTEMPSFFMMLTTADVSDMVSYLRQLATTATAGTVTGDPSQGAALFKSSGCSGCHMINGQGGDLGPELSRIGNMRGPSYLYKRLVDPGADLPTSGAEGDRGKWTRYLMYRAVTKSGQVVEGMRVGEDSFTIVLRTAEGDFHALYKPDLKSLEKQTGKSLMPSFKGTLSQAQLDDVVAYLSTLTGAQ